LWETIFTYDEVKGLEYKSAREYARARYRFRTFRIFISLAIRTSAIADLITIHVYAPPLGVLHTYKPGAGTKIAISTRPTIQRVLCRFDFRCLTKVSIVRSFPFVENVIVPLFPLLSTCTPASSHRFTTSGLGCQRLMFAN